MFKQYHSHSHTHDVKVTHGDKKVTVNEHKAPTDDSIRYADEMKQKVRESLMSAIKTDNNFLSVKAFHFEDLAMLENIIIVEYQLNNHKRKVEYRYNLLNSHDINFTVDIMNGLYTAIAEDLAKEIVRPAMVDAMPELIRSRDRSRER